MSALEQEDLFLTEEQLVKLTGRRAKSLQIKQLRSMLIPFHVNARGNPVVTRAAVIGNGESDSRAPQAWTPRVISR